MKNTCAEPDTTTRRLTQAERRDRSERELIAAAVKVVAEQGVSAATFDAIGREAGFSRGLATQRFGSKEGLIRSLIWHLHQWQGEVLEAGHVAEMDGLDALCAFVQLHCDSMTAQSESSAYFMLLAAAVADRLETRKAFAESHELERVLIRAFIEAGQKSGHIRPEIDADAEALMAGCSLLGLRMQSLIDPSFEPAPVCAALIGALRDHLEIKT